MRTPNKMNKKTKLSNDRYERNDTFLDNEDSTDSIRTDKVTLNAFELYDSLLQKNSSVSSVADGINGAIEVKKPVSMIRKRSYQKEELANGKFMILFHNFSFFYYYIFWKNCRLYCSC